MPKMGSSFNLAALNFEIEVCIACFVVTRVNALKKRLGVHLFINFACCYLELFAWHVSLNFCAALQVSSAGLARTVVSVPSQTLQSKSVRHC
jgi:hypothetical protein